MRRWRGREVEARKSIFPSFRFCFYLTVNRWLKEASLEASRFACHTFTLWSEDPLANTRPDRDKQMQEIVDASVLCRRRVKDEGETRA